MTTAFCFTIEFYSTNQWRLTMRPPFITPERSEYRSLLPTVHVIPCLSVAAETRVSFVVTLWFPQAYPLPRKRPLASRCLAMVYSGFQASCHNTSPPFLSSPEFFPPPIGLALLAACIMPCFMLNIFFQCQDGGDNFLGNVGWFSELYGVKFQTTTPHSHRCMNVKSNLLPLIRCCETSVVKTASLSNASINKPMTRMHGALPSRRL
jgi:hypothetical protein